MKTAHESINPIADHHCTMPDHGKPTATAACCRPKAITAAASLDTRSRVAAFWSDRQVWKVASKNTLNCLIGCSIGDFGMIVFLQAFYPATPMWLTMVLAMSAGLITSVLFESTLLRIKQGFAWGMALKTAFSMSFLSMLGMEFAANATDFMLTGGRIPLSDPTYWLALGISFAAGFVAPLPYNYYQFKKHGKQCH